ncbi:hypothetical protein [Rhodovulum sp. FJ3]|uniref:hypothetical protein n=1 Tax=Rhodovulum sp. FJ3 TaxID=3079053 RepID=UPI00293DEA19|nr:hypothetical protein [Rhodovulum sp. FJ3]MDV4167152.1 hypothetical protein [Rhodovulum sp. FJ3]
MVSEFRKDHELHKRRFGRNMGLGGVLIAFVLLVFGLTIVKISEGSSLQGFDHVVRPELAVEAQ